jgi:hypothetical protein
MIYYIVQCALQGICLYKDMRRLSLLPPWPLPRSFPLTRLISILILTLLLGCPLRPRPSPSTSPTLPFLLRSSHPLNLSPPLLALNDRLGGVITKFTLLRTIPRPGVVDMLIGDVLQLRQPKPDVLPAGVVVFRLLHDVEDTVTGIGGDTGN